MGSEEPQFESERPDFIIKNLLDKNAKYVSICGMARDNYIHNGDGYICPDDVIPRSAPGGYAATYNRPEGKVLSRSWSPRFLRRFEDAKKRLDRGESIENVRRIHGMIVVRTAFLDLHPKSRIVG